MNSEYSQSNQPINMVLADDTFEVIFQKLWRDL
jgi:hypothetical protein